MSIELDIYVIPKIACGLALRREIIYVQIGHFLLERLLLLHIHYLTLVPILVLQLLLELRHHRLVSGVR